MKRGNEGAQQRLGSVAKHDTQVRGATTARSSTPQHPERRRRHHRKHSPSQPKDFGVLPGGELLEEDRLAAAERRRKRLVPSQE